MTYSFGHILTFDIEHWYESWRLRNLPYDASLPDCDGPTLLKTLDLLDKYSAKATFFFTGRFAAEFPEIARECVARGHEIASHSQDHRLLTEYDDPEDFRVNLLESLDNIEKASGTRPIGFRAPKWTIFPKNAEAYLNILAREGLKYDSSFFPGRFAKADLLSPSLLKLPAGDLIEIPATGTTFGPWTIPAGGAWFRALPFFVARCMFKQKEALGKPAVFYAHPYDLNPNAHCPPGTPLKLKLIRRLGTAGALARLESLLRDYKFISAAEWIKTAAATLPMETVSRAG